MSQPSHSGPGVVEQTLTGDAAAQHFTFHLGWTTTSLYWERGPGTLYQKLQQTLLCPSHSFVTVSLFCAFLPVHLELTQTVEPSAFCNLKKTPGKSLAQGGGKFAPCTGRTHLPSRWCKWAPGILVAVREMVGESWRRWDFCQEVTMAIEIHLERQAVKTHHEEVVNYDQTWTSTTMQRGNFFFYK